MAVISIGRAIALHAAERPDAPALTCGAETRTWSELDRITNATDHPYNVKTLSALGVGEGLAKKDFTPANAAALMRQMLETPSYAANAKALAAKMAATNRLDAACEAIEALRA